MSDLSVTEIGRLESGEQGRGGQSQREKVGRREGVATKQRTVKVASFLDAPCCEFESGKFAIKLQNGG